MVDGSGRANLQTSKVLLFVGGVVSLTILLAQKRAAESVTPDVPTYHIAAIGTFGGSRALTETSGRRGSETVLRLDAPDDGQVAAQEEEETVIAQASPTKPQVREVPSYGHIAFCCIEQKGRHGDAKPKVTVLVWNEINGYVDWLRKDFLNDARTKCSTECHFTADRGRAKDADGVLFHGPNHSPSDVPGSKRQGQRWIFMSLEQPQYFRDPNVLRNEDYRRKFDYTSTYELDSSIPITCIHPHWDAEHYHTLEPLRFANKDGYGSPAAAVMFTSNCKNAGAEKRLGYLTELMKHMDVHSYGKCLHNRDEPPAPEGVSRAVNKQNVLKRYKFYLAFENNMKFRDYVSEKVFDGLLAGALPVYWGTTSIDSYMPAPHTVVRANDFEGPQQLAAFLKMLASNETAYSSYFGWKSRKPSDGFKRVLASTAYKYTSMCNVCEKLAADKGVEPPPLRSLMDVSQL